MKKAFFFLFCFWQSGILFSQATGDYRSAVSGNWNTAATWQRFNGTSWVAAITPPSSADGAVTIRNSHTITAVSAITADEALVASGGTLNISSNTFTVADGTGTDLQVDGDLQLSGTLAGAGLVTVLGSMQWTGGSMSVPVTVANGATLTINGGLNKDLNSMLTIASGATANWQEGTIRFNSGTLSISGTFNNSFDGTFGFNGGTNAVNINASGSFNKTAGTGITILNMAGNNEGTINVSSGTIQSSSARTNTGTINTAAGTFFSNTNTLNLNAGTTVTGNGTLLLEAGTVNMGVAVSIPATVGVTLSGSNIAGSELLTINGPMQWTGGSMSVPVTVANGATLTINGGLNKDLNSMLTIASGATANWQEGTIRFNSGTLSISGTFNNSFDGTFGFNGGTNAVVNDGVFEKKGGTGATVIGVPFTNTGIIRGIQTLTLSATFTNNGSIDPGLSPGILTINSSSPLFTTNSNLNIEMLSGDGPGTGHDQLQRSGNLTLDGALNVMETGNLPGGTYTIIRLTAGTVSGSFATVNLPAGYVLGTTSTTVFITKSTLPVQLVHFALRKIHEHSVELNWRTASEQNSDYFDVERSKDGNRFVQIGRVKAAGNSSNFLNYQFTDNQPARGINHYRLKQLNKDGSYTYSRVVTGKLEIPGFIFIAPNPVRNTLRVYSEPFDLLEITDLQGRIIKRFLYQSQQYDVSLLPAGLYLLRVVSADKVVTLRMKKE